MNAPPGGLKAPPIRVRLYPVCEKEQGRRSANDAVAQVHDSRGMEDARLLQLGRRVAEPVEEADAVAEQERRDVDLQLVDKPRGEILLRELCATGDQDVPVPGDRLRPLERRLDAAGDEEEGGL